jgi:hypothetical protein
MYTYACISQRFGKLIYIYNVVDGFIYRFFRAGDWNTCIYSHLCSMILPVESLFHLCGRSNHDDVWAASTIDVDEDHVALYLRYYN